MYDELQINEEIENYEWSLFFGNCKVTTSTKYNWMDQSPNIKF